MTKATTPSRSRRQFWMFALLSLVLAYLTALGATFNGVLALPDLQPFTLGMFGLLAALWLFTHWRRGWVWHRTLLDGVFVLWIIAFIASIVMNPVTWRRSVEGLWYMALYVSIWYMLWDVLANGRLSRQVLVESLLFTGFTVMMFGWYSVWLLVQANGLTDIPRPSGLIGNPNAFGAFILVLVPFAIVQTLNRKSRLPQIIMGIYTVSAVLLLILSQSRGAWIGFAASIAMLILLLLADRQLLSLAALKTWWTRQPFAVQISLIIVLVLVLLVGIFMTYFLIASISTPGRTIGLRTYLWNAAFAMFGESPIWGKGFFTFGQHLAEHASIPPTQPHSHAHNVPFTIAAEMGLLGLSAFGSTAFLVVKAIYRNWKTLTGSERGYYIAAVAAVAGFSIHHLLDTPSMMPIIAIVGLLILIVAVVPSEFTPLQATWHKVGHPIGLMVIWIALLVVGFWNINLYQEYFSILRSVVAAQDCRVTAGECETVDVEVYRYAAERMQALVDADPNQPAYLLHQAYLYGIAAVDGDTDSAERAIAIYQRYLALEPTHAAAWANLAALYWQTDNPTEAQVAMEQALHYAPDWTHFQRQHDIYSGTLSDAETILPPQPLFSSNWVLLQYLRQPLSPEMEYLPQVGWGN
jgi:putative inorganic carbon (hco3(-)) transporter